MTELIVYPNGPVLGQAADIDAEFSLVEAADLSTAQVLDADEYPDLSGQSVIYHNNGVGRVAIIRNPVETQEE